MTDLVAIFFICFFFFSLPSDVIVLVVPPHLHDMSVHPPSLALEQSHTLSVVYV